MNPGLEVVICTHNGKARLLRTLSALALQSLAPPAWSILVIDNNSSDGTAEFVRSTWGRPGVALRVVRETQPGLMCARLRAIAETDREFACFCDDDNWLEPDYLTLALAMMKTQPHIAALGGRGVAVSRVPLPAWFALAAHGYAVGPQGAEEAEVARERSFVYGAGMTLRLSAWRQLERTGFCPRLMGREPGRLASGDDNEMCLGLALLGWRIAYSPRLVFRHELSPGRLEERYCHRLFRSFGESSVVLNAYRDFLFGHATPGAWRWQALRRRAQGWLARLRQRRRPRHPPGPPTTASLHHDFMSGLAESFRLQSTGAGVSVLYADIAAWLARTRQ